MPYLSPISTRVTPTKWLPRNPGPAGPAHTDPYCTARVDLFNFVLTLNFVLLDRSLRVLLYCLCLP